MGVEQRHKFWLYPLVPNLFVFAAERQRRREAKEEEEDNCRAFEATLPGNCDRQLWQNKNGQVYSHGIIVLPNGSSRALLRRTWTPFRSFFSREEKLEKIFSFFLTRFFPRPFWRGRNKRLQHQRHTKAKEYDKPAICLVRLFCASWWSVMVYNVVFVCLVIVVVPTLLCSTLLIVNHVVYRKRDLWPGREMLRACAPIWEKRSIKVATRREKELE